MLSIILVNFQKIQPINMFPSCLKIHAKLKERDRASKGQMEDYYIRTSDDSVSHILSWICCFLVEVFPKITNTLLEANDV